MCDLLVKKVFADGIGSSEEVILSVEFSEKEVFDVKEDCDVFAVLAKIYPEWAHFEERKLRTFSAEQKMLLTYKGTKTEIVCKSVVKKLYRSPRVYQRGLQQYDVTVTHTVGEGKEKFVKNLSKKSVKREMSELLDEYYMGTNTFGRQDFIALGRENISMVDTGGDILELRIKNMAGKNNEVKEDNQFLSLDISHEVGGEYLFSRGEFFTVSFDTFAEGNRKVDLFEEKVLVQSPNPVDEKKEEKEINPVIDEFIDKERGMTLRITTQTKVIDEKKEDAGAGSTREGSFSLKQSLELSYGKNIVKIICNSVVEEFNNLYRKDFGVKRASIAVSHHYNGNDLHPYLHSIDNKFVEPLSWVREVEEENNKINLHEATPSGGIDFKMSMLGESSTFTDGGEIIYLHINNGIDWNASRERCEVTIITYKGKETFFFVPV